jgi:integrase/recombinase XerD
MAGEPTMSAELRARVDEYLRVRRALGFKLEDHGRLLPAFVTHLEQIGASTPTVEAALDWATEPQGVQPLRWKQRLAVVRGFLRWLHGLDLTTPVPPRDLLAYRRRRPTPYVMSAADISALLEAASRRPRPLSAATYHTLFGLLAATGMRVGEAVGLDNDDVDLDTGVITIRQTKYHKQRRIPVHATTAAALRDYLQLRQRLCPRPTTRCLFVSSRAGRVTTRRARAMFARIVKSAGLQPRDGALPRVHDLRHSFTVATLIDWYRDGEDVAARMPALSAYLGHVGPSSTYWYLQAVPELLTVAAQWLQQHRGQQP